jgi:hypothetical protein
MTKTNDSLFSAMLKVCNVNPVTKRVQYTARHIYVTFLCVGP